MIRLENVTKRLGGRAILKDVNLHIHEKETFVLVGASGTGKSVTLRHMVRLLTPDKGHIYIDDVAIDEARGTALEKIRARFGVLFQSGALLQWLTVGDNVALPLRQRTTMLQSEIDKEVREKLKLVHLEDVFDKYPSELSGGMQKRVALARAIITKPDIILYDEPTSGLDPVTSRTIDELIDNLRIELGVTSVVVTHDLHSALAIGSRIAMLSDGEIIECATPAEFIESDNLLVQSFLESQYITKQGVWERI